MTKVRVVRTYSGSLQIFAFLCENFLQIKSNFTKSYLIMLYFSLIHSKILYAIVLYANTYALHLQALIILNNRILRLLQYNSLKTNSIFLHKSYNTLPVINFSISNITFCSYNCILFISATACICL